MARLHKISSLPGLKTKTEENIIKGVELLKKSVKRLPLNMALASASNIIEELKSHAPINEISPAGSLRRMKETIRDIDILATSSDSNSVMDIFTSLPEINQVLAKGTTKSSILTSEGIQIDLRVVEPKNYGAAIMYFTGSKNHNIHLRERAIKLGYKINEYGLFQLKTQKKIAGASEEEIYKILGLQYIPPELRENQGEIELASQNKLPELVKISDIKGDLHIHSKWSDGAYTIEEIVQSAQKRGYSYIAITDHSKSLKVAGGLSEAELIEQVKQIRQLNKKMKNFKILCGTEVDIKSDGKLDFNDNILKEVDIVVAAIHTGFKQDEIMLTDRIISAMENKYVNIIAHPTGRLLGVHQAYAVNMEKILTTAKKTKTALEINSFPQRLDLNDIYTRRAKEKGVKLSVATDSHTLSQLDTMTMGLAVARRGWLERKDLLNSLSVNELFTELKK